MILQGGEDSFESEARLETPTHITDGEGQLCVSDTRKVSAPSRYLHDTNKHVH